MWIWLTMPQGDAVCVNMGLIERFQKSDKGDGAVLFKGGNSHVIIVRESPDEVARLLGVTRPTR